MQNRRWPYLLPVVHSMYIDMFPFPCYVMPPQLYTSCDEMCKQKFQKEPRTFLLTEQEDFWKLFHL